VHVPQTHDLLDLLTLLDHSGLPIPPDIREADALTHYAVEARYPGLAEAVTANEHARTVDLAERVLLWAQAQPPPSLRREQSK